MWRQRENGEPEVGKGVEPTRPRAASSVWHGEDGTHGRPDGPTVEGVSAAWVEDQPIDPERRGGANDGPDIGVVNNALEDSQGPGRSSDLTQNQAGRTREGHHHTAVNVEPGVPPEIGGLDLMHESPRSPHTVREGAYVFAVGPLRDDDHRPGLEAAGQSAQGYLGPLGDEQPVRRLQPTAQGYVGQPDEIVEHVGLAHPSTVGDIQCQTSQPIKTLIVRTDDQQVMCRGVARRVAAVSATTCLLLVTPGIAVAQSADDARAKARAAADVVRGLQPRVDAALAAYEGSLNGLAHDVSAGISAAQEADAATELHDDATRAAAQRIRALYMGGGQTGLLASVLDASSPSDLAQRIGTLRRVVDSDRQITSSTELVAQSAQAVAKQRAATADRTTATAGQAEARLAELTALLDQAQAALDSLDATAKRLEEAEQAAAAIAAARAEASAAQWGAVNTATARGIPVPFLAWYRGAAATCEGLPWPALAAIGQVESGHGTNPNDSPAGAQGPMQFLPSTFAAYAVDGDGDGAADIRNPADAIYSAARYLCANGGGKGDVGLMRAIYRYNHANWYVALVIRIGAQIAERFGEPPLPVYSPVAG